MGIQDRDYYRNEGPSIFDSLMPRGMMCRWLIGINVVMLILQIVAQTAARPNGDAPKLVRDEHGQVVAIQPSEGVVTDWLILDVDAVRHGQVWRLLTYAFLHSTGGWMLHLVFNMLFLWWFGSDIEQLYGGKEFLAIYLLSAFLGGVAYEIWGFAHQFRVGPCLGASGAVTTMLILCALHYPRRTIYFFAIVPMPIWLFAIFNVLLDFAGFLDVGDRSVAFCVHLAGAGFAVAYYKWQGSIVGTLSEIFWWKKSRTRARLKLFNPDPDNEEAVAVSANSAPQAAADEYLEAKADAVLEKILKSGKESLTTQEQEILKQAAAMYKRRRS
jgi:membrane associated rhomboid family serine protease